jgi:hypothetical protein
LKTVCLHWFGALILLISASWVARRIIDMSHQHLMKKKFLYRWWQEKKFFCKVCYPSMLFSIFPLGDTVKQATLLFIFCDTGVWTQGLHLEPLHQPFLCDVFFWNRVLQTSCCLCIHQINSD